MEELYKDNNTGGKLYVGDDNDFSKAKSKNFSILTAAKDGPNGHRSILDYDTMSAPKGKHYLSIKKGNHLALNLIDVDDPNFIPEKAVNEGLDFIDEELKKGHNVLVQCNQGLSRSPSLIFMYLRRIGELPYKYSSSYKIFKSLYDKYYPSQGIEHYVKKHWSSLYKE